MESLQLHAPAAVEKQFFAGRKQGNGTALHARAPRRQTGKNGLEMRAPQPAAGPEGAVERKARHCAWIACGGEALGAGVVAGVAMSAVAGTELFTVDGVAAAVGTRSMAGAVTTAASAASGAGTTALGSIAASSGAGAVGGGLTTTGRSRSVSSSA